MTTAYGIERTLEKRSLADAITEVSAALATEGFGILTTIDVKATFKKKLDVDFRPYTILGACKPSLAHQALSHDPQLGLLLPCNVVVQEGEGGVIVSAIDPEVMFQVSGDKSLGPIATEVGAALRRALDSLAP